MTVRGALRAPFARGRAVDVLDEIGHVLRRFVDVEIGHGQDLRRLAEVEEIDSLPSSGIDVNGGLAVRLLAVVALECEERVEGFVGAEPGIALVISSGDQADSLAIEAAVFDSAFALAGVERDALALRAGKR